MRRRSGDERALAIMYHDVVDPDRPDSSGFAGRAAAAYKLSPQQFGAHMREVQAAVGSGSIDLIDRFDDWSRRCPLFLTFDDGGSSAYDSIAGLLEQHGWRGHFFVTTRYVGRPGFLTRGQIQELRWRGHVIGSHSASHPVPMRSCSWDRLLSEWTESREMLSEVLGQPVTVASVPGGSYSRTVARAAEAAQIQVLFTSEPTASVEHVGACRVLGRYAVRQYTPPEISAAFALGRLGPRLRQAMAWKVKQTLKGSRVAVEAWLGRESRLN